MNSPLQRGKRVGRLHIVRSVCGREAFLQGLKPSLEQAFMSDLQVRPLKRIDTFVAHPALCTV